MSSIFTMSGSSKSQFKAAMAAPAPQWTEFLSCPICYNVFGETHNRPISLGCGHTICRVCLGKIEQKKCPFDQTVISHEIDELPVNFALLQLVGVAIPESADANRAADSLAENFKFYTSAKGCIEDMAIHLKPVFQASGGQAAGPGTPALSRPMQRKLVTLVNCQLLEDEGRARALRAARSLGERTVTELILQHQNPQQLSANLWAAVRARGCQFLGPAMQEEVLKLVLLALEDGSALSRKVLVLFAVQRLESQYTQASKTAVGHVVQLLYRASCFKVTKREEESSLMQLKDEFRTYEALRREHDSQIVQIATEAGLRISPEQWSSLLYGDAAHKSYMQSIIDKLQTPQSFFLSVSELMLALQRTNDPGNLSRLKPHFDLLANIDPSPDSPPPSWENLDAVMRSVLTVLEGLIDFVQARNSGKTDPIAHHNTKFKTSMCRDLIQKGRCPRGTTCTFAHSQEEMERFRNQTKKFGVKKGKGLLGGLSGASPGGAEDDFMTFSAMTSRQAGDPRPSTPTLQISRSSTVVPVTQQSVSVPVGKPSIMPMQAKKTICQQTIYTSPTHAREELFSPRPVPMSQRAPPPHIIYKGRPGMSSAGARTITTTSKITPTQVTPSVNPVLCLPPNPYTGNGRVSIPTTDSHYYLTSNIAASTRGKSPSQQLEELHRRKTELITQLNEAQCVSPGPEEASTPQASPPKPPTPPRPARPQTAERTPISKSVADSMATTLTTMAVLRVENEKSDCECVMSDSQYPATERTVYNSLVAKDPVVYKSAAVKTYGQAQVMSSRPAPPDYMSASGPVEPYPTFFTTEQECIFQEMTRSNYRLWLSEEEDEFIPFEHTVVSKFGPISRTARVKAKDTHPLQVQAAQAKDTTPVTAVTPVQRPYPVSYQVPSRFDPQTGFDSETMKDVLGGHSPDPKGLYVATSLPTALMQPNVVTAGATVKSNTLLRLRQKVLNLPGMPEPLAQNDREKIRSELSKLNDKIENLKMSEDERLARELQAVELNIQETQRQLKLDDKPTPSEVAKAEQAKAVRKVEEKRVQEVLDRKLAEKLVLEEARELYS